MRFSDRLFERGVFAQGIGYPTVAKGKARLRTIVTATHTDEDLDTALSILGEVGREPGCPRLRLAPFSFDFPTGWAIWSRPCP